MFKSLFLENVVDVENRSVAVCILSYNRPRYLREAILSVLQNGELVNDIIVCDNGSSLDTSSIVNEFRDRGVKWAGADGSKGGQWNFARAISLVDANFVMALHDDDKLLPDAIARQLAVFRANSRVVAVTSNGFEIDLHGVRSGKSLWPIISGVDFDECKSPICVIERYAGDSCLPPSPTLYKRAALLQCQLEPGVGQVDDAIVFTELSEFGFIVRLMHPIYEVRAHPDQDSSGISIGKSTTLLHYFLGHLERVNCARAGHIKKLLISQYSFRVFVCLVKAIMRLKVKEIIQIVRDVDWKYLSLKFLTLRIFIGFYRRVSKIGSALI